MYVYQGVTSGLNYTLRKKFHFLMIVENFYNTHTEINTSRELTNNLQVCERTEKV